MIKRLTALLLCLLLLPVGALGEAADGVRFSLSFEMNADAYPEDVQSAMPGIAALMNMLALDGELAATPAGQFNLDTRVTLNRSDRASAALSIAGTERFWYFRSPLLGDAVLYIDHQATTEFAIKAYNYLRVPLQRLAILLPVIHKSGVSVITAAAEPVLFGEEGSRVIPRDALRKLARQLSEQTQTDRLFRYWTQALAMESSYDSAISAFVSDLPAWVERHVPREGIVVTVAEDSEVWTAGPLTLLRRETDLSGAQRVSLTLPGSPAVTFEAALQPDGDLLHGSLDLLIAEDGEVLLDLHADGSLPAALPVTRAFSLTWEAGGKAVGGEGARLYFEGEPTGSGVILRQMTPDRDAVMLTVTAELSAIRREVTPGEAAHAFNLFTVNSDTLTELMGHIIKPMVRGLLPLVAEAPASSCQTLMNLMEDSGILGLLTEGLENPENVGGDWNEMDWDDEIEWDEGDWDDEIEWDEGDWDDEIEWDEGDGGDDPSDASGSWYDD